MELGLYILGTSAAVATRTRSLPCLAIVYRGTIVLMDPGEGCQRAMQEAGLSPLKVEAVAVTHLHGDHVFGLPGLLQTMTLYNRTKPLHIIGPNGLCELIEEAEKATLHRPRFETICTRVHHGTTIRIGKATLGAFTVRHTIEAYGYWFQEPPRPGRVDLEKAARLGIQPGPLLGLLQKGKPVTIGGRLVRPEEVVSPPRPGARIVYTGDTAPTQTIVEAAREATILVHDATFTEEMREEAHSQGHSTALDAAKTAQQANAKLLVLTHISARYNTPHAHIAEAKRIHPHVVAAEDQMKIPAKL